jgi:amino acid transporter
LDLARVDDVPRRALTVTDGVAFVVGIIIGSAIFETPSLVAANSGSAGSIIVVWTLGALISTIGALCYAELASTYPDCGGDYYYLTRAYGRDLGFLYAWARMTVIQTGSIALIAFVFGDYASQMFRLGPHSSALYAGGAAVILTLLHLLGIHLSRAGQRWLTAGQTLGLVVLIVGGFFLGVERAPAPQALSPGSFGLALVLVLLTYGGWNEAAFVSAELNEPRRDMVRVMLISIAIVGATYIAVNLVMLHQLGLERMARSEAVAADLMREMVGERGAVALSLLVVLCTLASINAMIFTCARTTYALGRDFRLFALLGKWRGERSVPANALLLQGGIILLLVLFGALTRDGFKTMVDYTAPVFWLFFLLTTLSLIRLRRKERQPRPFEVPLYPATPIVFAVICAYLLYSSVVYTGFGALVGLAVVASGVPLLALSRLRERSR